jgi:hypothetical protein
MINNNFPKIDDGTIYPEITKFIKNNEFVFNIDKLINVSILQNKLENYTFFKIANCVLNIKENFPNSKRAFITNSYYDGKLVDYIPIKQFEDIWKKDPKEWIYLLTYNKKIVKIGMTSSGLNSRYSSYNCGTKKAMRKGSAATTNFVVTESNYLALLKGFDVEIYAYEIPQIITEEIIFNLKKNVLNKRAHEFESTLIEIYQSLNGHIPPLCGAYRHN